MRRCASAEGAWPWQPRPPLPASSPRVGSPPPACCPDRSRTRWPGWPSRWGSTCLTRGATTPTTRPTRRRGLPSISRARIRRLPRTGPRPPPPSPPGRARPILASRGRRRARRGRRLVRRGRRRARLGRRLVRLGRRLVRLGRHLVRLGRRLVRLGRHRARQGRHLVSREPIRGGRGRRLVRRGSRATTSPRCPPVRSTTLAGARARRARRTCRRRALPSSGPAAIRPSRRPAIGPTSNTWAGLRNQVTDAVRADLGERLTDRSQICDSPPVVARRVVRRGTGP